jgi:hypothetical protein
MRATRARPPRRGPPVAGPSRATRRPPEQRARTAARASDPTTPVPCDSERHAKSTRQMSRTTTPTQVPHTHSTPRCALPDPLHPSFPAYASLPSPCTSALPDRFPGLLHVAPALARPLTLAAAPPPALRSSRLGCPARCLFAGRGRGVQREAVDPPSSKPRRGAKSGSEAGRRPVDLQASTPRDQH